MENCAQTIALHDHNYCRRGRASTRRPKRARCPCCRGDQVHPCSAPSASSRRGRKRKRTSVSPPAPRRRRGDATIRPAELPLPLLTRMVPSPQPSSTLLHRDAPLIINNHSVEEFQQIYHEVVDDMLTDESGQSRRYSLELGRAIKRKLWERLYCPWLTSSVGEDGLVYVEPTNRVGLSPPQYDVDISEEPED